MIAAAPPPELAIAVRGGDWTQVRTIVSALPAPPAPEVALVAARAHSLSGDHERALALLVQAIPAAGELAPALRIEAARLTLAAGDDPWPLLQALWSSRSVAAQRRLAAEILQQAWEKLPVELLTRRARSPLPSSLARQIAAALARRTGDTAAGIRLLREATDDQPALVTARWLAPRGGHTPGTRLLLGEALLTGGLWQEAKKVLEEDPSPPPQPVRSRWRFVRGRVAYRLGELTTAAARFEEALGCATTVDERFAAAVQRARVAELLGDGAGAVAYWDAARTADPAKIEGWDSGARARAGNGRGAEAVSLLLGAPPHARRIGGTRLAATLLARGDTALAVDVLARTPERSAAVRALLAAAAMIRGDTGTARREATSVLADRKAGGWRDLVMNILPPAAPATPPITATRDRRELAEIAVRRGAVGARQALALSLAADPVWARLLAGSVPDPEGWSGPAQRLSSVGLEREAAALYAHRFPSSTPAELAWSARTLASLGNGPASLTMGERLWAALGGVPAILVPDQVLPLILPSELVDGVVVSARAAGARPSWMVGVVRRESRFDHQARSAAGAVGIAQVVPETARAMGATVEELLDASRALELSGREVARLAATFDDRLTVAAAAYNAGDPVVSSWLARLGEETDELLFAAAVPYGETADYVLAVAEGSSLARHLR